MIYFRFGPDTAEHRSKALPGLLSGATLKGQRKGTRSVFAVVQSQVSNTSFTWSDRAKHFPSYTLETSLELCLLLSVTPTPPRGLCSHRCIGGTRKLLGQGVLCKVFSKYSPERWPLARDVC